MLPLFAPQVQAPAQFRPPAVPLVACDPYFSIWSRADRLTDVETTHWTGVEHGLHSSVVIDGREYGLMGKTSKPLEQQSVRVLPTRTVYDFAGSGVKLRLTFMTSALPNDLDILSRPVTYVTWEVRAADGRKHRVKLLFGASGAISVDDPKTQRWSDGPTRMAGLTGFWARSNTQRILGKTGDDRRIDWGTFYAIAPRGLGINSFALAYPGTADEKQIAGRMDFDLGSVGSGPVSRFLVLAYDDEYSIQYFNQNLRPYWRRKGMDAAGLLKQSIRDYPRLRAKCEGFDAELMGDLRRAGGEKYAQIGALAYRQCLAGNKIAADANGQPLLFPKENTSNGCIGTVDVIFPMAPQFLLFGPSLTKAMLVSNLDYASSPRWKWPFAPHDLGTYPKANGQVYGGGERTEENQMPVEETGNMLILLAALAKMEGNGRFSARYWPTLTRWADYLRAKGFDPENQLSTDDFMGHLAHNTNLSIKATLGLASYAYLCDTVGRRAEGARYRAIAQSFATRWAKEAWDQDHSLLAFDKPGSWSQKYNLVWDRILGFNLYPQSLIKREMAFYRRIANPYGVALDSRQNGTPAKVDWTLWSACLTGNRDDFDALVNPVYRYLNDSPERVGMGDLYNTRTGHHIGMHSRPVVGGVFLRLLYETPVWRKWAARELLSARGWAPLPPKPVFQSVVRTSEEAGQPYEYTFSRPQGVWQSPDYATVGWQSGQGGFGTPGTPGIRVRTGWSTPDIWVRRVFELADLPAGEPYLKVYHDEDAEIYLNGELVSREVGWTTSYESIPLGRLRKLLRRGRNVLAVHCHQTSGGQGLDLGLAVRVK